MIYNAIMKEGIHMELCLLVQYNYNNTITIAEPYHTEFFDYVEVCTADDLETAKKKAKEIFCDYEITFVNEDGDIV